MYHCLIEISTNIIICILQILLMILLIFFISRIVKKRAIDDNDNHIRRFLKLSIAATAGLLLPVNAYAWIPVISVLYGLGFKMYVLVPVVISNMVYNTGDMFDKNIFILKQTLLDSASAILIGILAGYIIWRLGDSDNQVIKKKVMMIFDMKKTDIKIIAGQVNEYIKSAAVYIIIGVSLDVVFRRYLLSSAIGYVYSSAAFSQIISVILRFDVYNTFFIGSYDLVHSLFDFTGITALFYMLRPKAFILYFPYITSCAVLMVIPALF